MRKIENNCVECQQGCIGCGRDKELVVFCDECGVQDVLYHFEGQELCAECVLDKLDVVEGSM